MGLRAGLHFLDKRAILPHQESNCASSVVQPIIWSLYRLFLVCVMISVVDRIVTGDIEYIVCWCIFLQ